MFSGCPKSGPPICALMRTRPGSSHVQISHLSYRISTVRMKLGTSPCLPMQWRKWEGRNPNAQRSSEHAHAPDSQHRRIPEEARRLSDRNLPGRRDRAHGRLEDRPAADPEDGRARSPQGRPRDRHGNGARCRVRRTLRASRSAAHGGCACWKPRSFTSPMRPLCSG